MRIFKNEARLEERIFPIERHAIQEQHALGIDKYFDVFKLEDVIARARLLSELELITQSRAAAAQDAEAQTARDSLACKSSADFLHRFGSDVNLFGCAFNRGSPRLNFRRTRKLSKLSHIVSNLHNERRLLTRAARN